MTNTSTTVPGPTPDQPRPSLLKRLGGLVTGLWERVESKPQEPRLAKFRIHQTGDAQAWAVDENLAIRGFDWRELRRFGTVDSAEDYLRRRIEAEKENRKAVEESYRRVQESAVLFDSNGERL
jgi:hypothetical protein